MRWIALSVPVVVLALLPALASADAAHPFQPSYDLVSLSDTTPGGHGNVAQHTAAPLGDHVIGYLKYTLPAGWDIANVQSGQDEPIVGTGQLQIDVGPPATSGCDGVPETYPLTIVDQGKNPGDPAEVETHWVLQGYQFQQFDFIVKSGPPQTIEGYMFTTPPDVCTPMSLDLTFQGVSTDNPATPEDELGRIVLTQPSTSGVYTWSVLFESKPVTSPPEHTITRCDQVGVGATATDTDSDGVADGCDNCPTTSNADQRDFDLDGTGDACDPDVDGDGVLNGPDQCPFTPLSQRPVDANGCSQAQVDQDMDGVCDPGKSSTLCTGSDNCPGTYNPNQANVVHPATPDGDACEDPDADGWMDNADVCPDTWDPFQLDGDLDGRGDACDPCPSNPDCDADNVSDGPADPDGGGPIVAGPDLCPATPPSQRPVDANGCSQAQVDQDLDGVCDPGSSSPTLCTGSDNCPTTPNADQANVVHPATPAGDACEDPDADGRMDSVDNCPDTANPLQEDVNTNGIGDACDPADSDGDGFSDRVEFAVGTKRGVRCATSPTDDANPADINNDTFTDITDIGALAGSFGKAVPPAPARHNIAPDPVDGFVDVTDIGRMAGFFGRSCL